MTTRIVPDPIPLPDLEARHTLRRRAGLDTATMGARIGVTGAAVSSWERGTREPSGKYRTRYAALLEDLDRERVAEDRRRARREAAEDRRWARIEAEHERRKAANEVADAGGAPRPYESTWPD